MPSITFEPTLLSTEDDLWALRKALKARGWLGTIGDGTKDKSPAEDAPVVTTLDMHAPATASNDGVLGLDGFRHLTATVGDMRVDIGTTITAMTAEAYTAMYGEEI